MIYIKLSAWQDVGRKLFGPDSNQWQFVCPDCGHVQKPQDFLDLGMSQKMVDTIVAYSCIKRWVDQSCMSAGSGPVQLTISESDPIRPTFDWNTK